MYLLSILCLVFCLTSNSCARKNRALFSFKQSPKLRWKKLHFPSPRLQPVQQQGTTLKLSWNDVTSHERPSDTSLIGYNVYPVNTRSLIMHNPCNTHPLSATNYDTALNKTIDGYCVRAVFSCHNTIISGPMSNIVYIKKLEFEN
jgi:hypothetical protein